MNRYIISPMVKHIQFLLIIILFTNFLLSQSVRSKCLLPTELKESSGIATIIPTPQIIFNPEMLYIAIGKQSLQMIMVIYILVILAIMQIAEWIKQSIL